MARYPEVAAELGQPRLLGAAPYQVLTIPLFDAELWTRREAFSWSEPFALSLTYKRAITGNALVNRSVSGMAARTQLNSRDQLSALLRTCFADVRRGDRITGISRSANEARFYLNGDQTCDITWPGFREAFFGIWLDADGNDRAFSQALRGGGRSR